LLAEHAFALVIFEHLMDVLPRMSNYHEPVGMRRAVRPLRRALAASNVAALATLHVNKAQAQVFRQRSQGTVQYGAMARSSFLVDRHPADPLSRVAVLAPVNYVSEEISHALKFAIADTLFDYGGQTFSVGRVIDVEPDETTMEDVLGKAEQPRKRDEIADALKVHIRRVQGANPLSTCTLHPGFTLAELARAVGRREKDGTVRNALDDLAAEGFVQQGEDKRWRPTPSLFEEVL